MFVGLKMLKNFIAMPPEALVEDAQRLMDEQQLWMLFVVKDGKLVGYVRTEDISAAMPSLVTGLDKHEINYLLSKLTVGRIMRKDITPVTPETEIEAAAMLMHAKNLAGLAVVNADGDLIGYINRTIMLEVLAEEMGYGKGGSRIVFEVVDRPGVLREVSGIIDAMGYSIISTGTFTHHERRMVVIRVDTPNPSSIAAALQKAGYDVVGPEDFKHEWQ
jgi:acetoin utilization protein AcuB